MTAHSHTVLVLPFTPSILNDPAHLLPLIDKATTESVKSCTILFSTPFQSGGQGDLYGTIRKSPRKYWSVFQRSLGKVYGTLGAAQWRTGRVLMDVEVLFEGMDIQMRLEGKEGLEVFVLDSYEGLPVMSKLRHVLGDFQPQVISTSTPLDRSSALSDITDKPVNDDQKDQSGYPTTALGGTFDHLHAAHKLLLHLSLYLTTKKIIVGLMTPSLLVSKSNPQLLEPLDERIRKVHNFLSRIDVTRTEGTGGKVGGGVELDVCEIHDPYGPTAWDGDIQALVVSKETVSGGEAVNTKRREGGLGELDIWVIDVIAAEPMPPGEGEGNRRDNGVEGVSIKTHDLTNETDETKLKALKMGSTAIRQWIKDHPDQA